jgi:hypothetical protein
VAPRLIEYQGCLSWLCARQLMTGLTIDSKTTMFI